MTSTKPLTFATTDKDFTATLNKRVHHYFKANNISRHANSEMVIKTVCMFLAYLLPYGLLVAGVITNIWIVIPLLLIMSLGLAGIGLSVMHDANHGAYSKYAFINTTLGYSLNMVGANAFNWKIQHNVLHHTFTNVHEEDEDISPRGILRMTPHSDWKWIHKFQFVYAWFLYGLMTIAWMFFKDFSRLIKYHKTGIAKKQNAHIGKEWIILIVTKIFYFGYIFLIPLLVSPFAWWQILIGVFGMHYIAGFLLAIIFQPAHVMDENEFPLPDETNTLENNWAIHQLKTTANFGNKSQWFSWCMGGLNYQIEHHLFPNICHVHYRKISPIVKETAKEFGLPHKSTHSFLAALISHGRLLHKLGKKPLSITA